MNEAAMAAMFPGFELVSVLWEGETALYPSEHSARWVIRQNHVHLTKARALVQVQGRLFIHKEKFNEVIRERAFASYSERWLAKAA